MVVIFRFPLPPQTGEKYYYIYFLVSFLVTQLFTFLSSIVDFPSAVRVSLDWAMMIAEVWERLRGKQHCFQPMRGRKEDKAGTDSRNSLPAV